MKLVSTLPFFTRDGSLEVAYPPLSRGAYEQLSHIKVTENLTLAQVFAQYKTLIFAMTDFTPEQFEALTAPDFLQLCRDLQTFTLTPADELREQPIDGHTFAFDLLFPFTNGLGQTIEHIEFKVPKVKHSEALANIDNNDEREDFMFQVVTGLSKADVARMAVNDYLTIKEQVGAFFTQAGDYFHPATLNHSSI